MRYLYLFFVFVNSEKFIKNIDVNPCRNCIYYNSKSNIELSKCKKFGEKNILTGDIEYNSASYCRKDEQKCGEQGKYFEQQPNLKFKMFKNKKATFINEVAFKKYYN